MISIKLLTVLSIIAFVHGGPTFGTFINGGKIASPDEHPFLAGVVSADDAHPWMAPSFHPGVILNEQTILTAARAVHGYTSFTIIVGATNTHEYEPTQQRFDVFKQSVTIHPDFDPTPTDRQAPNIALIKLSKQITFTDRIQPAPLLPKAAINSGFEFANQYGTVFGWDEDLFTVFTYTNRIPANAQCEFEVRVNAYHLCLHGIPSEGPRDYEGGAPLISTYDGKDVLVGVLSFTYSQKFSHGSVYSRLSDFAEWIEANSEVRFPE